MPTPFKTPSIQESGEDYLEKILMLRDKLPEVRSIDLAKSFHYSRPAVSKAVRILVQRGFLQVGKNGSLVLTPKGEDQASLILKRHRILTELFVDLGVSPAVAEADACKIEHDLHPETFKALSGLLKQVKKKR
jgi:DtxR family Mn-dependent transcriptional regulator